MGTVAWIVGLIVVAGFAPAGIAKIAGHAKMREAASHLGYPYEQFRFIGIAEAVGAVAVMIALLNDDLPWLGVFAALGLAIVGFGAVVVHHRAGDGMAAKVPVGVLGLLALVSLVALWAR